MELYLYKKESKTVILHMEHVETYTDNQVVTTGGIVYSPLAEDCELSSLPDCSETLREDWRKAHPTAESRLEELETLMAELLFGGETV